LGLIQSGFSSFSVAIQKPDDLILTETEGSHQGYNIGNNLAIAVNWATKDWLFPSFFWHIDPHTHDIVYGGCQCYGEPVKIPFTIWSSEAHVGNQFKYLYSLLKKTKLHASDSCTAETTWCFYIFLAVESICLTYKIPWLAERRK
jgi:hypothetical protein